MCTSLQGWTGADVRRASARGWEPTLLPCGRLRLCYLRPACCSGRPPRSSLAVSVAARCRSGDLVLDERDGQPRPPNGTIGRALTRGSLTSLEPVGVARSLHGSRASRRAQVLRIVTSLIRELGRGGAEASAQLATVGFRAGGSSGQIPDTKLGTEEVRYRRFQQPGSFYWGGDKPCELHVHCAPFGVGPGTASGGYWRASL